MNKTKKSILVVGAMIFTSLLISSIALAAQGNL
jgi:hypothetical protein